MQLKHQVSLHAATEGPYHPLLNLVPLSLLFDSNGFGDMRQTEFPVQLGLFHFVVALIGICFFWRSVRYRFVSCFYVFCILLIFP